MDFKLVIAIIIVVVILIYVMITHNQLVHLKNDVKEAFATMDVYLKKRWDLIPNIVNVVKGYAKHEESTLKDVVLLRNSVAVYDELTEEEKVKTNIELTRGISKIMLLVEAYPMLSADQNFLSLQNDLRKIEDEIAQSRKYYNAVIRNYNNKVQMIPSNLVAKLFQYKTKKMFAISNEERENVKVEF